MGSINFIRRGTLSHLSLLALFVMVGCSDPQASRGRFQNAGFPMGKSPNEKGVHSYLTSADQIDKNLEAGYVQWDFAANGDVTIKAVDKSAAKLTAVAMGKWRYPAEGLPNGNTGRTPQRTPGFDGGVPPVTENIANQNAAEPTAVEITCNRFEMERSGGRDAQLMYEQAVADGNIVMKEYFPPTLAECSGRPLLVVRDGEDGTIRDRDDFRISPMESTSYKILRDKPTSSGEYTFVKQSKFPKSLVMASPINEFVPAPAAQTYYVIPKWNIQKGMQIKDKLTWSRDDVTGVKPSGRRVNPLAVAPVADDLAEYRMMEPAGVKIFSQDNVAGSLPQEVTPLTPQITRGSTNYQINLPASGADERAINLQLNYAITDKVIVGHMTTVKVDRDGKVVQEPKDQIIK
jgi:hypothetical protein